MSFMTRLVTLFATAAVVLLLLGLLMSRLHLRSGLSLSLPAGGWLIPYWVLCFGAALFFCLFAFAYSLLDGALECSGRHVALWAKRLLRWTVCAFRNRDGQVRDSRLLINAVGYTNWLRVVGDANLCCVYCVLRNASSLPACPGLLPFRWPAPLFATCASRITLMFCRIGSEVSGRW